MTTGNVVWAQDIVVNEFPDGCGFLRARFSIDTGNPATTITDITWDLGNGNNSTGNTPEALYSTPGDYTVSASGELSDGSTFNNITATITVKAPPTAVINTTGLTTGTCALSPLQVTFDGSASTDPEGGALTYFWVLGDGTVSNEETITHSYDSPGVYNVTLTVRDEQGCSNITTLSQDITVAEGFNLAFNATGQRQTCTIPNTIRFEATHDVGNYEYLWDFGDGTTSNLQNPEHTYTVIGDYTVDLTVTNLDNGCSININEPNYVQIAELSPEIILTGDAFGCAPLFTTFENISNIILPDQEVTWDFGDGTIVTGTADSLLAPFHTYNSPGVFDVTLTVTDPVTGCEGSFILDDVVEVPESPIADFSADNTGFCVDNFTVNFTDNSTGATGWEWDFGDGNTSTAQNPSHTYTDFGSYTVTLRVTGLGDCTSEIVRQEYINSAPTVAYFGAFELGGCAPDFTTTLVDSTSAAVDITNYTWTITNARTGAVVNPVYTGIDPLISLQDTGVYNVTLDVETAEGCNSSFTRNNFLSVGVPPTTIDFTPSATLICNGTTVDFTNTSTGFETGPNNPYETTWGWDYLGMDTIMDTSFDGSFTYDNSDPNPINVALYAFNNGCVDTLIVENALKIELPKADFDTYTDPCMPDSLFIADASLGADRFEWEITVDGNTTVINNIRNPVVFVPPGASWSVTQMVENDDARNGEGCTHSVTQTGTQPTFGMPDFSGINLTNLSSGICFPAQYQFDANAVTVDGGNITNYYWDFGNGQVQAGVNPIVNYDEPGFYSVSLIITTEDGCKFETLLPDFVKVYGPEINFEVCDAGTCKDREVSFRDLSSSIASIVSWEWDFGDGNTSTEQNPVHTYETVNDPQWEFYWTKLTVTDELGCTASDSVKVRPTKPVPAYDIVQQPDCGGEMVGFINVDSLSEGLQPFSAQWTFSDGQAAGGLEPVLFFEGNSQGIDYTGSLILFDLNSCSDTVDIAFTVTTDSLVAAFTSDNTGVPECPPYTVNFIDTSFVLNAVFVDSFGINQPVDWIWNFGDGNQLTGTPNPAYTYTEPGTYDVTLITQDALGCFDTLLVEDYITIDGPEGDLIVSDTIGYPDLTVDFTALPASPNYVITWDFGNGEFGEGENTQYAYTEPGVYLAGLILLDSMSGCQDLVGTQRVEVLPCPVVNDTVFDYCVSEGDLLLDSFDSTHVLRLGTMNYIWQDITDVANPIALGDSASIMVIPPPEVNQTQTPQTRTYQLEVFVSNLTHNYTENGANPDIKCNQIVTYEVTFLPSPEAQLEYALNCAEVQNLVGGTPANVQVRENSILNGNVIANRYWDTNNDSLFNEQIGDITFVFPADTAGIYTIGLVVESATNGCTDTLRSSIFVPGADFGLGNACAGQEIQFLDSTVFDPNLGIDPVYSWDFDEDGNPDSNEQNPLFTFDTPGDKIVTLRVDVPIPTVTGTQICEVSITKTVEVNPNPDASFTVLSSCLGTPTTFEGSANPNIISYIWDFDNDGTIDTVTTQGNNSISRIYNTNGEQSLALTVVSTDSCTDTQVRTFDIVPNPIADFSPVNCSIDGITFMDLSSIDTSEVSTSIFLREIDLNDGQGFRVVADLNTFTFNPNTSGQYPITYRVTSDLGCIDDTTKILTIPEADFMVENVCFGEEAQFLDQSATFGSPIILYEWDFDSDGTIDAQGTSASFAYPAVGTFDATLTITNISGCTATITKQVNVRDAPVVEAIPDVFICGGDSVELSASISSLNTIVGVEWDNNAGSGETVIVSPTETTLYTVVATDETGCTGEDFVLVNVVDLPYIPTDTLICEGNTFTIDATIPGGIPAVYAWSTGSLDPVIEITEPGIYTLEAIATNFDVAGRECIFTHTVEVRFNTSPLPLEDNITACFIDGPLAISLPSNFVNVVWSSDVLENPVVANDIAISEEGAYFVSATNELGCELSDSLFIRELCEPLVFLPNAFTPNGDGLNDGFEVKGANFLNFELTIYNRWGELVFQTTDEERPWMGNFNGNPAPAGLYPYVVKFESELDPGEPIVRYGNVNLIR